MENNLIINNKYKIIKKIASGGMADVFLGIDTSSEKEKKFAVKILHEKYNKDKNFVSRFKREAEILSKLSSPNIVSVYDWGSLENFYYIVMDYVNGKTLKEIIETKGNIDVETAVDYLIQICNALKIAHLNGLIHRDIKPQNIMVDENGVIKITDFGIAKFTAEDVTKTINIIGSAHYISPEHLEGKVLDFRSDIYSLGIVMFEMLTGDLPFRGSSSMDISLKHLTEIPQPPSSIITSLPKKIDKIVLKCLEKNPENRYQSVDILKKDLENFINQKPLSIEDKTLPEKQKKYTFKRLNLKGLNLLRTIFLISFFILFIVFMSLYIKTNNELKYLNIQSQFIQVPNIVNTEINSASQILSNFSLKLEISGKINDDNFPANYIIEQNPSQNTKVIKGSTIYVKINEISQKNFITIPNFIGLEIEEVKKIVKSLNLDVGLINEEFNDFFPKGKVIRQYPDAGAQVELDSKINLTISNDKQLIIIPDVKGYDFISAKNSIEALGLIINVKKFTNLDAQPGTVLGTEPIEGSSVEKNSIVNIIISTKEQLLTTPDLLNLDINSAKKILDDAKIKYEISPVNVNYAIQKNTVIWQIPNPQTQISQNDQVLLFVGQ